MGYRPTVDPGRFRQLAGVPSAKRSRKRCLRRTMYDEQDGRCIYCHRGVTLDGNPFSPAFATIDHMVPKSRGGPDGRENLILACRACNQAKGDLTVEEFIDRCRAEAASGDTPPIDIMGPGTSPYPC